LGRTAKPRENGLGGGGGKGGARGEEIKTREIQRVELDKIIETKRTFWW